MSYISIFFYIFFPLYFHISFHLFLFNLQIFCSTNSEIRYTELETRNFLKRTNPMEHKTAQKNAEGLILEIYKSQQMQHLMKEST